MVNKSAEALWKDYSFLTKEMKKFLYQNDLELFYELVNQRERLQEMLEKAPEDKFKSTPQGQKFFAELNQENQVIQHLLQTKFFKAKHKRKVAETYTDGLDNPTLNRVNYQL